MIAQIKTLANAKEIEVKQKEYQKIAEQNQMIDFRNQSITDESQKEARYEFPIVPDQEFGSTDIHFKANKIDLAFVNTNGEISIKYGGDNFNLIYSDKTWKEVTNAIEFNEYN